MSNNTNSFNLIPVIKVDVWCKSYYGTDKQQYGITIYDPNGEECDEEIDSYIRECDLRRDFPTRKSILDYVAFESIYSKHYKNGSLIMLNCHDFWSQNVCFLSNQFENRWLNPDIDGTKLIA